MRHGLPSRSSWPGFLLASVLGLSVGCIDAKPDIPACQAGQQTTCACADGTTGIQTCASDGSGFSPCSCPNEEDSGPGGTDPKQPGQPCPTEGAIVCDDARTSALVCESGRYHSVYECPSGSTCFEVSDGSSISCDDGLEQLGWWAPAGAACYSETNAACSFDDRTPVNCTGGIWTAEEMCPGRCGLIPPGERSVSGRCPPDSEPGCVGCVLPEEGDPCSDRGIMLCNEAETGALRCDGSSYHTGYDCPDGESCLDTATRHAIQCGAHMQYAVDGDTCTNSNQAACSFDGTVLLSCSGVWFGTECPNYCGFLAPGQSENEVTCGADEPVGCAICY